MQQCDFKMIVFCELVVQSQIEGNVILSSLEALLYSLTCHLSVEMILSQFVRAEAHR